MKQLLFSLLFFTFSVSIHSQEGGTAKIVSIDEVTFPPSWKGCETKGFPCTFKAMQHHLLRNFNSKLPGQDEKERTVLMNIKFIIDSEGKVVWAKAVGPTREIEAEGERIVGNFSKLNPGRHEGKEVNVLVDFPLKLNFGKKWNAEGFVTADFNELDSPPLLGNCSGDQDLKLCASKQVQDFVNFNMKPGRMPAGVHKTLVKFVIDQEGEIQDILAEGINERLNLEAIRVVGNLPKFKPGFKDGQSVNTLYLLPITLSIQY